MSIDFSGSTQSLDFSGSNIDVSKRLSFSIWVYRNANATFRRLFMINDDTSGERSGFQVAQDFDGTQSFNIGVSRGNSVTWGAATDARRRLTGIVNNKWYNICGTASADTVSGNGIKTLESMFINGLELTTTAGDSFSAGTSNERVYVAARSDNASYFNGRCAEPTIWEDGRILTQEDADALFAGMPTTLIEPEKIKFYAPLHQLNGVDLITGNAATKTGSPVTAEHAPIIGSHYSFIPVAAVAGGTILPFRMRY